jgi:cytochrome c-type biogenesis protein CcmH/NrfG
MESAISSEAAAGEILQGRQVYLLATICLMLGLGIGYAMRGIEQPAPHELSAAAPSASRHAPTLDDMRRMADRQAAPLLAKLKSSPNDSSLLVQIAGIYHGSHQFKEAASYYDRAVQADQKNVALRTKLASSLYRSGDIDGAIAQLNEGLRYEPNDANSLFNLGMIRLQGKGDGKAALTAWRLLLKSNPQLSPDRRAEVQKLIADVLTSLAAQRAVQGAAGK